MNEESEFAKLKKQGSGKKDKEELLDKADQADQADQDKESEGEDPEDTESKEEPKEEPKDDKESDEEPEEAECDDGEDCSDKKDKIKESNMKLMVDMSTDVISEIEINEATNDKIYVIKGTFSSPGKKNRNGRVYSKDIWEDNVIKYQDEIKNSTINTLSELEHPPRSTVDQWEAVAKTRLLEMRDGLVYGEMEILNNNDKKTNQIKALIEAGIKIGVSTRGVGRMKGSIVEEYQLITTDIVSNPSDFGANLQGFSESMILESTNYSVQDGKITCNEHGCSIVESKPSPKTKCQSGAKKLLEALSGYTELDVVISEAEKLATKIIKDNISEKKEAFDFKTLQKTIKTLEDQIAAAKAAGAMYGNISKFEKELKNIKDYAKSTGMTESPADAYNDIYKELKDGKKPTQFRQKIMSKYDMSKNDVNYIIDDALEDIEQEGN